MANIPVTPKQKLHRFQQDIMGVVFRSIWLRSRKATMECINLISMGVRQPMSEKYAKWYPRAIKLISKLMLPENRFYWRTTLLYERSTKEYHNWRINCLNRDNWQCQACESTKELNVHHIKSYKNNHESRIDPDNGITLCKKCHKTEHKKVKYGL